MRIAVHFYSYFKDLTGCATAFVDVPTETTLGNLHLEVMQTFPKLEPMKKSTLLAVGVDYQPAGYIMKEGDEVSLFPPVQGG